MEIAADIAAGIAGVALGAWAGWKLVKRYGRSRSRFWGLNAAFFVGCVSLCAVGGWMGATWLVIGSLALLLGALTGLKYGWHGGLPRGAGVREESA